MQIDKKVFHDLISKRKTAIHIPSVLNARRFAPHVYLPRIVCFRKTELAQFTFMALRNLIYHISFFIFGVNCAFLAYRYFAIAAYLMLLV